MTLDPAIIDACKGFPHWLTGDSAAMLATLPSESVHFFLDTPTLLDRIGPLA